MLITCSDCQKKLKVPDTSIGKKVRCPHCKALVAVPNPEVAVDEPELATPNEEAIQEAAPKKRPARRDADDDDEAFEEGPPRNKSARRSNRDDDDDEDADDAMRCARCDSSAIRKLPPNAFSRNPGFVCTKCKTVMRPPGSTGVYVFAMLMGGFLVLFGIALLVAAIMAENVRGKAFGGAGALAALGLTTAIWGITQMRLPVPRNAPPFRWLLWIAVILVVLFFATLVLGGCIFGFMYFLHEMM